MLQREEDSMWFRYGRPSGQPDSDTLKCMGESWAGCFPHSELKITGEGEGRRGKES